MRLVLLLLSFVCALYAQQQWCKDVKISTSETVMDSPVLKEKPPLWIAPDYTTVFAFTSGKTLWRSTNAGRTFTKVEFKDTVRVRDVQLSSDKKLILVAPEGNTETLFTSNDGGATWNTLKTPGKMEGFKFHPQKPNWILAMRNTCPGFNCSYDLYLTQDFGLNWMPLRTYVWLYDWLGKDDIIIVWERNEKSGTQYLPPFDSQVVKSAFFFRSLPQVIAEEVVGYLSVNSHIFIAKEDVSGGLSLLVSVDSGDSFHDTRFPVPGGRLERRYTILDTSEGSTFVNVDHTGLGESNWGNLYTGDSFDADFTMSLEYNPRTYNGRCDFKRVQGLEGVYIANQYTKTSTDTTQLGSGKQTLITYDKGGSWNRLPKPVNYVGECKVEQDCQLNLYGNSNNGEWYSRAEAIGLIISTGMTGPYIVSDSSQLGVYFSRDAGWAWEYITNGSFTYEIGNRGAILLMTYDIELTNLMRYSVDEGLNWTTCRMLNETFDVDDIVSDPKMASGVFLIYGKRGEKGVILQVDFADVHENDCKGHDRPDAPDSDYETWVPSDSKGSNCLLGRRTKYVRRKRAAKCDNPFDSDAKDFTIVQNCSCTELNYQCDYCYTRVGTACAPDTLNCPNFDPKKPPEKCVGTWYETRGYRRVPGDTCDPTAGVDHMPISHECPYHAPEPAPTLPETRGPSVKVDGGATTVIGLLIIFAFIALILVIFWYLSGRNPTVRDYAAKCIPEKFLPDFKIPGAAYSVLEEDVDNDAPALEIDNDSDDNVHEELDDKKLDDDEEL